MAKKTYTKIPPTKPKTGMDALRELFDYTTSFGLDDAAKAKVSKSLQNAKQDTKKAFTDMKDFISNPFVDPYKGTKYERNKSDGPFPSLFAYGGTAMNVDSPSEALSKSQRVTQDAQMGSMYDELVMGLQGLGSMAIGQGTALMSQGISAGGGLGEIFGNMGGRANAKVTNILPGAQVQRAAMGGTMGAAVNAEGGEVVETPDGQMEELQGPSHATGGIDMEVPNGTEIFSKRLKGEDGKSMAKRKIEREKNIARMQKLLEKDPSNPTLRKTMERIMSNNEKLDTKDVAQMDYMREMTKNMAQSFALGGTTGEDEIDPITGLPYPYPAGFKPPAYIQGNTGDIEEVIIPHVKAIPQKYAGINTDVNIPNLDIILKSLSVPGPTPSAPVTPKTVSQSKPNATGAGFTLGDTIGMASNLLGPIAQMQNTKRNRAATPTEVNAFKNFGEDSLKKIQGQYGYIDQVKDSKLADAELSRQGTMNRNNNSARGINTQRALNLASDAQHNELKSGIYDQFAAQTMGIMGQEAQQMNQNDNYQMRGEQIRAEKELQNTDNFYSNQGRNISDMFAGIGQTGKSLNDMKERTTANQILKDMNNNFSFNPFTGEWDTKKTTGAVVDKGAQAQLRTQGTPITIPETVATTPETVSAIQGKGTTFSSKFKPDTEFSSNLEKAVVKLNIPSLNLDNKEEVKKLQKALGVKANGIIGEGTYTSIKKLIK